VSKPVREAAQAHAPAAIAELVRLAAEAESEATRLAAIREILDRAYGKPVQHQSVDASVSAEHTHHTPLDADEGATARWLEEVLKEHQDRERAALIELGEATSKGPLN
jgi:hypothetical protein